MNAISKAKIDFFTKQVKKVKFWDLGKQGMCKNNEYRDMRVNEKGAIKTNNMDNKEYCIYMNHREIEKM